MQKWEQVELNRRYGCFDSYDFYEELSNGQVLGVFVQKTGESSFNFAVCIQDTKELCEDWGKTGGDGYLTGKCGLEGLAKAFRLLKWFIENRLPEGSEIQVHGWGRNGKVWRAVKRLGFETSYTQESESLYVFFK